MPDPSRNDLFLLCHAAADHGRRLCGRESAALWSEIEIGPDAQLCEQDFRTHEGLPCEQMSDIGPRTLELLAGHCPPSGKSFGDMVARLRPVAVMAHAGIVMRAAWGIALGQPHSGLAGDVQPLSVTRLRGMPQGFAAPSVNGPTV